MRSIAGKFPIVIGRGVGVDHPDLLAERLECEGHRQLRSDRVAVGPRVRRQQKPLAPEDSSADGAEHSASVASGGLAVVVLFIIGVGIAAGRRSPGSRRCTRFARLAARR